MIKRIIQQYFICEHKDRKILREIRDLSTVNFYQKTQWFDRLKCNDCSREYYGERYVKVDGEKHFM